MVNRLFVVKIIAFLVKIFCSLVKIFAFLAKIIALSISQSKYLLWGDVLYTFMEKEVACKMNA